MKHTRRQQIPLALDQTVLVTGLSALHHDRQQEVRKHPN